MPTFTQTGLGVRHDSFVVSRVLQARAESSSEAAALPNGEKALTPIIAGTVSGTCVGVAWLIALIVIIVKRCRRRRRYKKVGQSVNDELTAKRAEEERRRAEFILPPDPAVLEGGYMPGERIDVEQKRRWWKAKARRASMSRRRASMSDGYGPGSKSGKGKDRDLERPTSPGKPLSAPERRRHSFSNHQYLKPQQHLVETSDKLLRPPYHPLSTIISVSDSQRFIARTPPAVEPPSSKPPPDGDSAQREDVKDVDFAAPIEPDDKPLVEHDSPQEHRYPPSCSH